MVIKLKINPSSVSLDMLSPPDPSSAYSLSGHISLSLASSHTLFEGRRAVRIHLRSLVITFEGQAEIVTPEIGYAAVRLCSIAKELVLTTTVELSNEGGENGEQSCTWHALFDLAIPGWLPASDQYGDCRLGFSGTQYNLYATAKFQNAGATFGPSWISSLYSPFSSRNEVRVIHAERCGITLNRFAFPLRSLALRMPAFYSVTPSAEALRPKDNPHPIPVHIVSKIELLASVPEHISLGHEKFPFALSIRASSLSKSEAAKLRLSHMFLELQQVDEYTSSASSYKALYPLPSSKEQPPHKALRDAHPVHKLYDIGLIATSRPFFFDDAYSLLPGCERFDIPFDSVDHARSCAKGLHPRRWFTIETRVPITRSPSRHRKGYDTSEWTGTPRLRATSQGPFFCVRHSLRAIAVLSYGRPEDGEANLPKSFLAFTLPLSFVRLQSTARTRFSSAAPALLPTTMQLSVPHDMSELPAYSQLFYPNGDSRHDDSIPLPLYTPPVGSLQTDVGEDGHT